jgi:hypothetical protein
VSTCSASDGSVGREQNIALGKKLVCRLAAAHEARRRRRVAQFYTFRARRLAEIREKENLTALNACLDRHRRSDARSPAWLLSRPSGSFANDRHSIPRPAPRREEFPDDPSKLLDVLRQVRAFADGHLDG